ncbi:hypothetical protein GCM10012286_35300 [Streptomyces lasiicapitis]|uniref:Uncharacterized protein n=1 Tax=Streptomyces lasiicapitis TaxID=1923961 RepID=A0ABQ2M0X8_9ACTN|nr:hypothetical protein GCM10012286_35300 [Streptomyces lasiicapitis]
MLIAGRGVRKAGQEQPTLFLRPVAHRQDAYAGRHGRDECGGHGGRSAARDVRHGKRGTIRQAYRGGTEDQLGALGLVLKRHRALDDPLHRCRRRPTPRREPRDPR